MALRRKQESANQKLTSVRASPFSDEKLPTLLFPPKNKSEEAWLTRLRREKRIWKVGPRLYSSVGRAETESAIKTQWSNIVAKLFPNAQLSYRSALEFKPSDKQKIILTGGTNRTITYPGLTLHFVRGPTPLASDPPFLGFRTSSLARAFLENISLDQRTKWRNLTESEIELRLYAILQARGESELMALREQSRIVATALVQVGGSHVASFHADSTLPL